MTRRTGVALGGLILVGALLRIAHWDPGLASDDTNYMNYAAQLLQGEPFPRDVHSARLGYLAFLAAGMGLTFVSTVVCQSLGIGIFIATSLLLFALTRRLSSEMEGLLAVFLFVWLPLDIIFATSVFPDTLMTFLVLAAGLLYLIAKTEATSVRQFAIACAGGFVLGMAASVKEVAVLASVAVVIDLLVTQRDRRALFLVTGMAMGGAVAISIELIGFMYLTEDPFFRTRSVLATAGSSGPRPWINPFDLRKSFYYVFVGVNSLGAFGIHGYLLLIGSVRILSRRSPIEFFPFVLKAVLGVYLSIGSMSLTR
jgi:4-amino-4-deoxy-L-arabinose transferase-like glycosyltransferase